MKKTKVRHNKYALNNEARCVIATHTSKAEKPFHCLVCKEAVHLRVGEKNKPHFAHFGDNPCSGGGGGGGESEEHIAAKRLVKENLHRIQIYHRCRHNGCTNEIDLWEKCLFEYGDFTIEEEANLEGYRVDICVKERETGKIRAVIEVKHTHATEREKVLALYKLLDSTKEVVEINTAEILVYLQIEYPVWRLENTLMLNRHCDQCYSEVKMMEMRKRW